MRNGICLSLETHELVERGQLRIEGTVFFWKHGVRYIDATYPGAVRADLAYNLTLGYYHSRDLERSGSQVEGGRVRGKEVWVTMHGRDAGNLGKRILKDAGVE